jgi:P pilus assembly chaperone PapD
MLIDTASPKIATEMKRGNTINVRVNNLADSRAFVTATPVLIRAEGVADDSGKVVEMTNADSKKYGFLVSPRRFVISANSSQIIKLIFPPTKNVQKVDHVYRVYIEPVENFSLKEDEPQLAGVKLKVRYALLVIQRPKNAKPDLAVNCVNGKFTAKNTGNTNVLLSHFQLCDKKNQCKSIDNGERLYANSNWQFDAKNTAKIKYETFFGDEQSNLEVSCR